MIKRFKVWLLAAALGAVALGAALARAFSLGQQSGERDAHEDGHEADQGRAVDIRRRVDAARGRLRDDQSDRRGYRD